MLEMHRGELCASVHSVLLRQLQCETARLCEWDVRASWEPSLRESLQAAHRALDASTGTRRLLSLGKDML